MTLRLLALLALALAPVSGQGAPSLRDLSDSLLSRTPLKFGYEYRIIADDFEEVTAGTLYVAARSQFRLTLFDKIYGSDGSSLYLHDRNTHQTIIDSIRDDGLNVWIDLLRGDLPENMSVSTSSAGDGSWRYTLASPAAQWRAEALVDSATYAIRAVNVHEASGWRHEVVLGVMMDWPSKTPLTWVTLQDLPGVRLDLR